MDAELSSEPALSLLSADAWDVFQRDTTPFAVFIDQLEVLENPDAVHIIRDLTLRLPPHGIIVVGSRRPPRIGMGRLRTQGQLIELGPEDLRFSVDEVSEFFRLCGIVRFGPDIAARVHDRTGGWVAAVELECQRLRNSAGGVESDTSTLGRLLADFIGEEVFVPQADDVKQFMLDTCVLNQFDASTCAQMFPKHDCSTILDYLASTGLLRLLPDPPTADTAYEFEHLLKLFLRHHLAVTSPGRMAELRAVAGRWFEANGRIDAAIDRALEGGEYERALVLLEAHAQSLLRDGHFRSLARWFRAIPISLLTNRNALRAVGMLFQRGRGRAVMSAEWLSATSNGDQGTFADFTAAIRRLALALQDRHDEDQGRSCNSCDDRNYNRPFAASLTFNLEAHAASINGELERALWLLDRVRGIAVDDTLNLTLADAIEASLDCSRGRMLDAAVRLEAVLGNLTTARKLGNHPAAGTLYASILYERNELEHAEAWLEAQLPILDLVGFPDHLIIGYLTRCRIRYARGDTAGALLSLVELERVSRIRGLPRALLTTRLERAHIAGRNGNEIEACEELDRADNNEVWRNVSRRRYPAHDDLDMALARLRWDANFGDATAAVRRIDRALAAAGSERRVRRGWKLRAIKLVALWRIRADSAALEVARGLLQAGSQQRFVRLVVDEGPSIVEPFLAAITSLRRSSSNNDGLTTYGARLLDAFGKALPNAEGQPTTVSPQSTSAEPLTNKEHQVLKCLAEGDSNCRISDRLFISDSTVRTHLRNINMKLGASSRTQAVSLARKMGYLR